MLTYNQQRVRMRAADEAHARRMTEIAAHFGHTLKAFRAMSEEEKIDIFDAYRNSMKNNPSKA